jgi:hypothetical protein
MRQPSLRRVFGLAFLFVVVCGSAGSSATAASAIHAFTVAGGAQALSRPVVHGTLVAWLQGKWNPHPRLRHVSLGDVYGRDLRSSRRFRITTHLTAVTDPTEPEGPAGQLAVGDRVVVWTDCRHCRDVGGLGGVAGSEMYARDLRSGRETRLPRANTAAVAGRTVFWADCCGIRQLHATNVVSGHTWLPVNDGNPQAAPATDGRTVVWMESRGGTWDIVGKKVRSGRPFVVARPRGTNALSNPHVSGNLVIWTRGGLSNAAIAIEGKNLRTGKRYRIARVPQGRYIGWTGPQIAVSGTIVTWDQSTRDLGPHGAPFEVLGKNIATGRLFRVATGSRSASDPSMSGRLIVWQSSRRDPRTGRLQRSWIEGTRLQ